MSSIPPHRKPLKRGGLLEHHRRVAGERFHEHVERDRVHQREIRRRHLAQASGFRDFVPTNDEILVLLDKISKQMGQVPSLLEQSNQMLHTVNMEDERGSSYKLLSLPSIVSPEGTCAKRDTPSGASSSESLEWLLEQLTELLLSSLPFVNDVERVFGCLIDNGAEIFPRLIEVTISASPDLDKVVGENFVFLSLSIMTLICWQSPSRAMDLKYQSTFHAIACRDRRHSQQHHAPPSLPPLSLRCVQLSLWSLTVLETSASFAVLPPSSLPSTIFSSASDFTTEESDLMTATTRLTKLLLSIASKPQTSRDFLPLGDSPEHSTHRPTHHPAHHPTHHISLHPTPEPLASDPLSSVVGLLLPFGGHLGLCETVLQLTAAFSKYERICLQFISSGQLDDTVSFLRLSMNGIFSPLKTEALSHPVFSPDSPLRRGVADALLTVERCLMVVCNETGSRHILDVSQLQDILETVFALGHSVLQSHPIPLHSIPSDQPFYPSFSPDNPIWKAFQSIILLNDSDVGLDHLASRPSDILVPCIHIIGLICDHELRGHQYAQQPHHHEQDRDHGRTVPTSDASHLQLISQFIKFDGILRGPREYSSSSVVVQPSQSQLVIPCLLSRHLGIRLATLDLLSLLAVAGDVYELIAVKLTPVACSFLASEEPSFVKRAAVLLLLHTSFHPDARYLPEILQLDLPTSSSLNSLARPIDQVTDRPELQFNECRLCDGRLSVIDVILMQFNPQQYDVPLLNMCLDYLEEVLIHAPTLKGLLFRHGVIEKIESVQTVDDDARLFHRTVTFVQRHYDDFEDAQEVNRL